MPSELRSGDRDKDDTNVSRTETGTPYSISKKIHRSPCEEPHMRPLHHSCFPALRQQSVAIYSNRTRLAFGYRRWGTRCGPHHRNTARPDKYSRARYDSVGEGIFKGDAEKVAIGNSSPATLSIPPKGMGYRADAAVDAAYPLWPGHCPSQLRMIRC